MSKRILFLAVDPEGAGTFERMKIYERRDIGYIAAMLTNKNHNVLVYDKDIKNVDFSELDDFNPDVICLPQQTDLKIIEWVKSKKPGALIGWNTGIITDSKLAKLYMERDNLVDFTPIGGEVFNTWVDLVQGLELGEGLKNVNGIVYREGKEIIENGGIYDFDIKELRTSDWSSTNENVYITTSLGCIGNCSFCSEKLMHKKWKGRDVDSVIKEIEYFTDNGKSKFVFSDAEIEAPDVKLKKLEQLCLEIIKLDRLIYYQANFRPDFSRKATPQIMFLLSMSGLYRAFIGVESGCQDDLDIFNKKCTVQEAKNTVKLFEKNGIYTRIGFIMFQPFSTIESLTQNIDMLEELGKASFESIFSFYRDQIGCKLHNRIEEAGLYDNNDRRYRFKESSIYPIYNHIKLYFDSLKPAIDKYQSASDWEDWYHYAAEAFKRTGRDEQYESVKTYLDRMGAIKKSMSVNLCNWFRKLLEIAREGFNTEKAIGISCSLLNECLITETAKYLEREREKLDNTLMGTN